jgi:CRP-like cAMP-binding protein
LHDGPFHSDGNGIAGSAGRKKATCAAEHTTPGIARIVHGGYRSLWAPTSDAPEFRFSSKGVTDWFTTLLDKFLEADRMTDQSHGANRVLASIPPNDYKRLQGSLEPIDLKFGEALYEPGRAIRHVYFPIDCLISLLTAVDKRRTLEVGMVGNEGMAGMPFILGMGVSGVRAIVQGGGSALRMDAAPFRIEFDRNRPLQEALFRYTYALMAQISQTAACNRFHEAEARLSRWLLMTRDRVGANEFLLTQEFLAHMLGLRREGVTEAASALKQRKLISYTRGKIQILDVRGLKAASCSCYHLVKKVFDRAQA